MQHTHKPISLVEIKATNKDGTRLYETPEGNEYPSITTVLSIRNKQGLNAWRKRVGNDVANYISRTAACSWYCRSSYVRRLLKQSRHAKPH